jgi:hypothetical protein
MHTQYAEQYEGAYRVAGSRVSLDSLVYAFWDGKSPETIAQSFPTLTLEQGLCWRTPTSTLGRLFGTQSSTLEGH